MLKWAAEKSPAAGACLGSMDFAGAVDRHKSMVFSIAYHFLRDRALAEELSQDVFLQLHRHWADIQSADHLVFWLRKVTSHRCIDEVRRKKQKIEFSLTDAAEPTTLERVQDPLLSQYLQRMIGTLPEKQRAMVILRYQEDMDPEEISKLLGMNVSTVKTSLHRAVELLRSKMSQRLRWGTRTDDDGSV